MENAPTYNSIRQPRYVAVIGFAVMLLLSALIGVRIGIERSQASPQLSEMQFSPSLLGEIGTNADEIAGPLPDDVIESQGPVDYSRIPQYIEVLDRDGKVAGYAESDRVFDPTQDQTAPFPVFAKDLKEVVGHFHFEIGFVPIGVEASEFEAIEGELGEG